MIVVNWKRQPKTLIEISFVRLQVKKYFHIFFVFYIVSKWHYETIVDIYFSGIPSNYNRKYLLSIGWSLELNIVLYLIYIILSLYCECEVKCMLLPEMCKCAINCVTTPQHRRRSLKTCAANSKSNCTTAHGASEQGRWR